MLVLFAVVFCRIIWIQLVTGTEMAARAKSQVGQEFILQTPRGTIYDRSDRQLAVSLLTKSLFIDPDSVKEAADFVPELSAIIGMSEADINACIARGGGFVWLKRCMPHEEYEAVRQLIQDKGLNCLGFEDESKRFYPNDMLAANVLGFVGTDDKGLDGIEYSCDDIIKGKSLRHRVIVDNSNRPIFDSVLSNEDFEKCKSIQLTLDSTIQFIVEQNLDKAKAETGAKAVTAIVMDPKTGEILAMANRPSYNPNSFWSYPEASFKNLGVSFVYEPGSTFKSVVAAAALQEGTVTANTVIQDNGYIMVSGRRIQNWDGESHGAVPFSDIIKFSLNTGFAQVGLNLGAEKLNDYVRLFGFGKATDVDLPGEESGILFETDKMRDSDLATMSIGQSIAVTPIQLVTAMSAIANDGVLLKPHIIKKVYKPDGSVEKENSPVEVRRVISKETASSLVGLLEQVVASGGGSKAAVRGYRIGGKTGTAQKAREDGAGYYDGRYIASFCGFAPVEDPRVTVLVIIDDPQGIYYGGQIAAPVAGRIFEEILRYLNIKPISNTIDMKQFESVDRTPEDKAESAMMAAVPQGKVLVPHLKGKTIRQAAEDLAAAGLRLNSEGNGTAYDTVPPQGTPVDPGTEITVYFKAD
jgi:stage V sporulation protein D (sporulation-specific penicillin-binding protein)